MDEQISKKAALVAVKDALMAWSCMPEWRDEKILEAIAELPSAEPKRGKWSPADSLYHGAPFYYCSECGEKMLDTVMGKPRWNFCPHCGADMRGEQNA